ncbi:hypothetical protein [Aeromicrobium endophyticum]|nr:hypothetical protein [Aeromicrobium endophyticum]
MRISRTIVVVLLSGALAIALGAFVVFHGSSYDDVLHDTGASADDVIAVAGSPSGVARAGDGSVLLTFSIRDQEGGEEEKGAWRLMAPDGDVVRSGATRAFSTPHGFDDGFVVAAPDAEVPPTRIDLDGSTTSGGPTQPPAPVRPGDILVTDVGLLTFYRPSDGSVHELPPPGRHSRSDAFERVAIDEDGTIWGVTDRAERTARLVHSADGGRTWETDALTLPTAGAPGDLVTGHGVTLLSLVAGMSDGIVGATIVDGGEPRPFAPDGLRLRALDHTKTVVLPDGRLVLGEDDPHGSAGWFVATTQANSAFEPLDVPEKTSSITSSGGALYAVAGPDDAGELWQSLDGGATWTRVDVGGR